MGRAGRGRARASSLSGSGPWTRAKAGQSVVVGMAASGGGEADDAAAQDVATSPWWLVGEAVSEMPAACPTSINASRTPPSRMVTDFSEMTEMSDIFFCIKEFFSRDLFVDPSKKFSHM